MLYMSLWADKSARHIVELMITGTVMGIVDTIKAEKDLKTKNEELNAMVAEFKQMQEDFYEKLKKQLLVGLCRFHLKCKEMLLRQKF